MDTDKTSGDTGADGKAGDNAADAAKDTTTRTDGSDMPREINGPKVRSPPAMATGNRRAAAAISSGAIQMHRGCQ